MIGEVRVTKKLMKVGSVRNTKTLNVLVVKINLHINVVKPLVGSYVVVIYVMIVNIQSVLMVVIQVVIYQKELKVRIGNGLNVMGMMSCTKSLKKMGIGFFFNLEKGESYKDGDFKNSTHWLIGPEHDSEGDGDWEPITSEQWNDALAQWQKAIDIRGGK